MTQRIPGGMPIHNWVDRLIAEAEERGDFDDLPGAGKPLPGLDQPLDENWWLRQKIRDEEVPSDVLLPPALQLRKEVRALPQTVRDLPDEASVRALVSDVNRRIADWIRAPSGPVLPIAPARVDDIVASWRAVRTERHPAASEDPARQPDHADPGAADNENTMRTSTGWRGRWNQRRRQRRD